MTNRTRPQSHTRHFARIGHPHKTRPRSTPPKTPPRPSHSLCRWCLAKYAKASRAQAYCSRACRLAHAKHDYNARYHRGEIPTRQPKQRTAI